MPEKQHDNDHFPVKLLTRFRQYSPSLGVYLFLGVFLLCVSVLAHLTVSPFLLPARGDMHFYNDWARRILAGESEGPFAFYGLPGYAYLLAFFYRLFGYNPFVPGFVQALLNAGIALLIYRIARRVLPESLISDRARQVVAAIAVIGWAFFVPAEAYAVILMPTVWFVFVFWLLVWRVIRKDSAPDCWESLLLGLLVGLAATGVATILFLAILIVSALLLKPAAAPKRRWQEAAAGVALLLVGVVAGSSPCWIHNYFIARDRVFLSAHSGINFWIGNNPEANGYPRFPPGLRAGQAAMLQDSISQAESVAGHSLKRAEVSAYWSNQVRNFIRQHPTKWLRLLLIKVRNFWNAFQYDDLSIITSLREEGVILPGLYFGLVAALGLPGIVFALRISHHARWVLFAVLLEMVALLPVFITERYRLAAVPGLLVFAVVGLWIFWRSIVLKKVGETALYLALLFGSTALVSWPQRDPSLWALDAYNSGWQALEAGNLVLAEKKLLRAEAYVPTNPETKFALGNLRLAQGDRNAAKTLYYAVLNYDGTHRGAVNNLGVLAMEDHQYAEAERWFRRGLEIDSRNAKSHFLLATVLFAQGNREEALREANSAIALSPRQAEFQQLLDQIEKGGPPP